MALLEKVQVFLTDTILDIVIKRAFRHREILRLGGGLPEPGCLTLTTIKRGGTDRQEFSIEQSLGPCPDILKWQNFS